MYATRLVGAYRQCGWRGWPAYESSEYGQDARRTKLTREARTAGVQWRRRPRQVWGCSLPRVKASAGETVMWVGSLLPYCPITMLAVKVGVRPKGEVA